MNKNKYFIEFAKKKVESIAKSIEDKNPVSKGDRLWLRDQKRSYLKNPNKFNKTRLKLLDSLIPLLGYDWKVGVNLPMKTTLLNIEIIKEKLEQGEKIPSKEKQWLNKQGFKYRKSEKNFSKQKITELDKLTPLLGYDWRVPGTYLEQLRQSKAREIRSTLKQGKPLSMNLRRWLYSQQKVYEAAPEKFDKEFLSLLDTLTPLLGYDWKIYYRLKQIHSIEMLHKLSSTLKSKRKLSSDLKIWIRVQRDMYRDHPNTYQIEKKEQLDALPYIMGTLYNGGAYPSEWQTDKNNLKAQRTRAGHTIVFDDTEGKEELHIYDKDQNSIISYISHEQSLKIHATENLDITAKNINIQVEENINIQAKQHIETSAEGDIKTLAQGKIAMQSDGNTEIKSKSSLAIEATSDLTATGMNAIIEGKTGAELNGTQTKVTGKALTEVSAGIVKIN